MPGLPENGFPVFKLETTLLVSLLVVCFSSGLRGQTGAQPSGQDAGDEIVRVETYPVASILLQLEEEAGRVGAEAERWLKQRLGTLCSAGQAGDADSRAAQAAEPVPGRGPFDSLGSVSLAGTELVVRGTSEDHRKVREALETLEQFGIRQVIIRAHVFQEEVTEGQSAAMAALPIHWSHVEAQSRIAETPESSVQPAFYAGGALRLPAANHTASSVTTEKDDLQPPQGVTSATWTEATSIIERSTPVLYTLLAPRESRGLLAALKRSESIETVMSPTVAVFNGMVAKISNASERPLVTGIKPTVVELEGRQQIEFVPGIRVYSEGTSMQLRPELVDGKQVRLSYQLKICKIQKVDTLDIHRADGRGDFTIQIPEVASTQFRASLDLPLDYSLVVRTTDTDPEGVRRSTLIVCQCSAGDVAD